MSTGREEIREALSLVDGEPPGMAPQIALEVGFQERDVGRSLQVELRPAWAGRTDEGALSTLARSVDEKDREVPEHPPELLAGCSGHVLHDPAILHSHYKITR
jgi:hypothetical protein